MNLTTFGFVRHCLRFAASARVISIRAWPDESPDEPPGEVVLPGGVWGGVPVALPAGVLVVLPAEAADAIPGAGLDGVPALLPEGSTGACSHSCGDGVEVWFLRRLPDARSAWLRDWGAIPDVALDWRHWVWSRSISTRLAVYRSV